MALTIETICTRVRAAVDSLVESRTDGVSLVTDQKNLDAVIKDKIRYGLMYVLQNASGDILDDAASKLDVTTLPTDDVKQEGNLWSVKLPAGTLRILSARLSVWRKAPDPVDESSPEALMQLDEYARGSWDRPVTVLRREGGRLWLDFYSGRGRETKSDINVAYIAMPELLESTTGADGTVIVTDVDPVPVPAKTEGAFIYYVAALTMTAFREDIAQSLFSIAGQQLGITAQTQEGQ